MYSLTHLLTHSLTHSLTYLLTHSLTHSLTHHLAGLVCIFGISAVGITHIYEVQPWHSTHVDDANDHKFIDDEVKSSKQNKKDKIKNNEFYPVNT